MRNTTVSLVLCALVACTASTASANTGQIQFQGQVTNATCMVDGGTSGPSSFTVELPTVSAAQLGPGQTAGRTRFPMQLRDCQDVVGVRAYFEAGPGVDPATATLRPSNNGPVHFALFDQDGSQIPVGSELQSGTIYAANDTMYYEVAYQRVGAAAITPGSFFGTVTYSLAYD